MLIKEESRREKIRKQKWPEGEAVSLGTFGELRYRSVVAFEDFGRTSFSGSGSWSVALPSHKPAPRSSPAGTTASLACSWTTAAVAAPTRKAPMNGIGEMV